MNLDEMLELCSAARAPLVLVHPSTADEADALIQAMGYKVERSEHVPIGTAYIIREQTWPLVHVTWGPA